MIQAWLLLPVILGLLSLGWGLGVERIAGRRLPGVLLLPVGFASLMVAARLLTATQITVGLTTPLVVVAAFAGYFVGITRLRAAAPDRWLAAAAVGTFAVFAAPVVLSGHATFAGYGVLGDTAVQFVLTDALLSEHGDPKAFPLSAFSTTVASYKAAGYPLGTHAALGAVRPLVGIDVAWAYQPFLAFLMALQTLTLAALLRGVIRSRPWLAAFAFVAAQPALVYSFALQGSIKELATLWLIPLLVALVPWLVRGERGGVREIVPLAAVSGAAIAAVGPAAAVWLGPILVVALVLLAKRRAWSARALVLPVAAFVLMLAVLALPTLAPLASSVDAQGTVLTSKEEVGNLIFPLQLRQIFGVWINGDYRLRPPGGSLFSHERVTHFFLGAVLLVALGGLWRSARDRRLGPLLYFGASMLALVLVARTGSPWAQGKALVIATPAVFVIAGVGLEDLRRRRPRVALAVGVVVMVGVLASNFFAYRSSSLAPRDRLAELGTLNAKLTGKGPTLSTEFEEYTKHFLRDARPVGASEVGTPGLQPHAAEGEKLRFGAPVDLDQLSISDVQRFPAIVVRRSPVASRPPSGYRRTWQGTYYEVWQRRAPGRVVARLPLGSAQNAAGPASCSAVSTLAATAPGGDLVGSVPAPRAIVAVTLAKLPATWGRRPNDPNLLGTSGAGRIDSQVTVVQGGAQRVWLLGSFGRPVDVSIDGREVGQAGSELAQPAGWLDLGRVDLAPGRHRVDIVRGGASLRPQNGDANRTLGPVALVPTSARASMVRVPASRWRELCGRSFDWIESVRK